MKGRMVSNNSSRDYHPGPRSSLAVLESQTEQSKSMDSMMCSSHSFETPAVAMADVHQRSNQTLDYVRMRNNFRGGGYIPPETPGIVPKNRPPTPENRSKSSQRFKEKTSFRPVGAADYRSASPEIPFDALQQNPDGHSRTPPEPGSGYEHATDPYLTGQLPNSSYWRNQNLLEPTRFSLKPPRFSEPTMLHVQNGQRVATQEMAASFLDNLQLEDDEDKDEEDSLFDFEPGEPGEIITKANSEEKKTAKASKRPRRRARYEDAEYETDDTSLTSLELSIEGGKKSATPNLQERAAQAWKSRRIKNASLVKNSSLRETGSPRRNKATNVSFGKSNTVHHYQPEDEYDDVEEATTMSNSFDDRSLNSEYSKTLESEVEDMIKDIFLIGDAQTSRPGRRKLKYRHDAQKIAKARKAAQKESEPRSSSHIMSSIDEGEESGEISVPRNEGNDSIGRIRNAKGNNRSEEEGKKKAKGTPEDEYLDEDPLGAAWVWDYVTAALGVEEKGHDHLTNKDTTKRITEKPLRKIQDKEEPCGEMFPLETCGGIGRASPFVVEKQTKKNQIAKERENPKQRERESVKQNERVKPKEKVQEREIVKANSPMQEMFTQAQEMLQRNVEHSMSALSNSHDEEDSTLFPISNMANDPRLVELALHAAISLHHVNGVEYDDSTPIDMVRDVKVNIGHLHLPLGLIFLENDGGCFVTKVSSTGSAAKSGAVEIGDQLAAINGVNCIEKTVDDICSMIKEAPNTNKLELAFLRYVGPFRPRQPSVNEGDAYDLDYANIEDPMQMTYTPGGNQNFPKKSKKGFRWLGFGKKKKG